MTSTERANRQSVSPVPLDNASLIRSSEEIQNSGADMSSLMIRPLQLKARNASHLRQKLGLGQKLSDVLWQDDMPAMPYASVIPF